LNQSESNDEEFPEIALDQLEGWKPKSQVDQIMLQKFLQRPESEQNQQTRQHFHTGTQFAAAFSAESHDEEIAFTESPEPNILKKR